MFKITNGRLDVASIARLATLQQPIDQQTRYADKAAKAQTQWKSKRDDAVFGQVLDRLVSMNPVGECCYYCCGSEAGILDHFQPKSLYPERTFAWSNFIHACERCNTRHKLDKWAVLVGDTPSELVDVTRPRKAPVLPPRSGKTALINPRREDPMEFLRLDLAGTFKFESVYEQDSIDWYRAAYTIKLLGLNSRDYLIRERRVAYEGMVRFLNRYREASESGNAREMLRMRRNIREISHQAVWQELVRSHERIPEVAAIFAACPELMRRRL